MNVDMCITDSGLFSKSYWVKCRIDFEEVEIASIDELGLSNHVVIESPLTGGAAAFQAKHADDFARLGTSAKTSRAIRVKEFLRGKVVDVGPYRHMVAAQDAMDELKERLQGLKDAMKRVDRPKSQTFKL